jgi:hypothetical protein
MRIEYTTTPDDVFHLKRFLHGRVRRHPAILSLAAGSILLTLGGTIMAATGSWAWSALAFGGVALGAATWAAVHKSAAARDRVERDYAALAWLRQPYRLELDDAGLSYAHGPFSARLSWSAFARLAETDHHLVLMEHSGPAAMAYGLPKRELDRHGGAAAWKEFIRRHLPA